MSIVTVTQADDEVFRAFAAGRAMTGDTTRSEELPGPAGHAALSSHGVVFALRSEEVVVFDALPHAEGCPVLCRLVAHSGRAAVHVHEHFEDGEVEWLDHSAFVELARRLGAVSELIRAAA